MIITRANRWSQWSGLLLILLAIGLVVWFSPLEKTLGERIRLIYFHGAWVWAGKAAFAAAAGAGLAGLALRQRVWQRASLALGRTGMVFWITYLPMSLLIQQMNWGGIFWDEPRWRIPLMFGITGLFLHAGLTLIEDLRLSSAANLVFGVALWSALASIQNVLHPDSPIYQSEAFRIQLFFTALVVLSLIFAAGTAWLFYQINTARWK
jgi:hypothetical protein